MAMFPSFDSGDLPPQAARLAPKLQALAERGIYFGTSSWKYEGWLSTIYSPERYTTRGKVSMKKFEETCLTEYARTFSTLCGDFAFYVRRVVSRCIPFSRKEFLGQRNWAIRLTYGRKARGTTACRKSGERPESTKVEARKTRTVWPRQERFSPGLRTKLSRVRRASPLE